MCGRARVCLLGCWVGVCMCVCVHMCMMFTLFPRDRAGGESESVQDCAESKQARQSGSPSFFSYITCRCCCLVFLLQPKEITHSVFPVQHSSCRRSFPCARRSLTLFRTKQSERKEQLHFHGGCYGPIETGLITWVQTLVVVY